MISKFTSAAIALGLSATVAQAQNTVVQSETVVRSEPVVTAPANVQRSSTVRTSEVSPDGDVTQKTTTVNSTAYETRLHSAYRTAGLTQAEIDRVYAYDLKVREARRANDAAKVAEYYEQQARLLKPEQVTKVRTYFVENPAPATIPAYERTTWEVEPVRTGVHLDTPLGSIGIGGTKNTVVEKKEIVPAQQVR